MKYFSKIVWLIMAFNLILLVVVAATFQVDNMTLSKGKVDTFNTGWELTGEDGVSIVLEELPFLGKSNPGEIVVAKNIIPKEFYGKTMGFLSADKVLKVWLDEELVYEFGVNDVRAFGHTPGSVYNFIDIPADLDEGLIRMEMTSPYKDYAARLCSINIGDRDVLILQLLRDNLGNILLNMVILICAVVFFLLFIIRISSRQKADGMQYLCGYCTVAALYYFVETKVLHIFYGNQTFYSVLVFLCLMMIPFFISLYYANGVLGVYKLRWKILLGLISVNVVVQMILQLFNVVDFMNMVFFSHGLIALTVIVVGKSYLDIMKEKRDKSIIIGMIGLLFMGIGGTIDIIRMYVVAVGDMGKFSRLGTTCFAIIMLYQHFGQIIKGYSSNVEENARLLKREMEYVAKKNEQLEEANRQAEEARLEALSANASKDKFLAHMSHEIRTPINAVLGMNTMILRETGEMPIKEYALDIQNAGQNLLSLINDILDFSKIESGKLEIIPVEYDMSSLIYDISNMVKAKAEAKKLKLNIHVDENLPSKLLGDDVRIRQIVVNLLNNAVKYTKEGEITLNVEGRVEGRKAVMDFSVKDTGIGIKEEDIEKLFREFERIEEKRNRNVEGTGLGINITTQLLLLMGSRLNVESVYGEGSRFYFSLEQQIVDSTPIGDLEERIRKEATEYSYAATFTAKDAHILVVDDNLVNLKVFVNLLKCTKVNVDVADGGKSCLEMIRNKYYDLIFLDHMMPEMDGLETLRHMKEMQDNKCKHSPVVALTANAITGAKEMYLSEGFDAFLPKPINPVKLEQMILKLLPRDLLRFDVEDEQGLPDKIVIKDSDAFDVSELPMIDGIDWNYGYMHLPDKELLISTVQDFYKTLETEADSLERFYKECRNNPEMIKQYRIKVHAMKSTANLIGAIVPGGLARVLENAAKDEDLLTIDAMHDIFIREWLGYKDKLMDCAFIESGHNDESMKETKEADSSVIQTYLQSLRMAMDEFDIDVMDEVMKQLEALHCKDEVSARITRLSAFVTNMDTQQGIELIDEIIALLS